MNVRGWLVRVWLSLKEDRMTFPFGLSTLVAALVFVTTAPVGLAAPADASAALTYTGDSRSLVPLAGTQKYSPWLQRSGSCSPTNRWGPKG